jgi:hypothetical protein
MRSARVCLVEDSRESSGHGERGECGGSAMKVATSVIAVGLVGFIIVNIVNRDDIIRYFKMRQM